ncbi:response regulator [Gelidibacter japonicus]|uniref:hybrid sensor histidine kinase/response regulator n=1 Tax=Gelidibacter japonicus TaxID=1962232 RepID=UPI0020213556|nr:response regulator [Gelidibacter japonicus]MCL8009076.1 response regulator [Gelidibacter japonicus]
MEPDTKKDLKILIADDQQKNIQVLGSLLRQENYIIGVAMNGRQALEMLLQSNDYDLVLMDINMPIMNGIEACKAIREHENLKEIPIIFLTALVESESIVMGFEAGGQDYVTKPFNSNELLARVNTHLELKQNRDSLRQVNNWLEQKVKERTEELTVANSQLLKLDTAKTEFLNIISHEIRTPLHGIIGALGILNEYHLPEEIKELLYIMEISANRLEEFSLKALDISLLNTKGKAILNLNKEDLTDIISSKVNALKSQADKKSISIILQNEGRDICTMLDKTFIDKCVSYLIDNAIKFGNRNSEIFIKTMEHSKNLVVTIEDEGKHFPDNYNFSDIEVFGTNSHIDQNPALSLFLCKKIIEAHNGKIEIGNTQNGAKVSFVLPKIG